VFEQIAGEGFQAGVDLSLDTAQFFVRSIITCDVRVRNRINE